MSSEQHLLDLTLTVAAYVTNRFDGDFAAAFEHYDADHDRRIDKDELHEFLADAGVGNDQTRWAWTLGTLVELDRDGNGLLEWDEFEERFSGAMLA